MKSCGVLRTRAATNTELAVFLANGIGWLNYQAIAADLEHACNGFRLEVSRERILVFAVAAWSAIFAMQQCDHALSQQIGSSEICACQMEEAGARKVTWLTSQVSNWCRARGTQLPQGLCQTPKYSKPTPEASDLLLWSHYCCGID